MCRFVVINFNPGTGLVALLDPYGKHHLAQLAHGSCARIGMELHGPRAALGRHFLVATPAGQRLELDFLRLNLARQALLALLQPLQAPQPRPSTALRRLPQGAPAAR